MMYRAEDKFQCSEMEMRILQSRVGAVLKADSNQSDDFGYKVTSLYFDDIYDSCLRDTESGVGIRQKYRVRIYNNSLQAIKLEIKYKRYNRVHKKSAGISREQLEALIHGKRMEDLSPASDNPVTIFNAAISQRGLRPKVIVEYDRKAYVFAAGNVRITFDRNVRASRRVTEFGDAALTYTPVTGNNNVLEVKYDEFLPGFIAQLMEMGNMNQSTFSKYRMCSEVFQNHRGD